MLNDSHKRSWRRIIELACIFHDHESIIPTTSTSRATSRSIIDSMTSTKAKSEANKARVLYWFRTDLRIHDSPALQAALDLEHEIGIEAFYPVG